MLIKKSFWLWLMRCGARLMAVCTVVTALGVPGDVLPAGKIERNSSCDPQLPSSNRITEANLAAQRASVVTSR